MVPQFSYSSTPLFHDIAPAVPINWVDDIPRENDPDFMDKVDDRLLWRGSTTGMYHKEGDLWRSQQRIRLITWANEKNGTTSVLRSTKSRDERVGEPQSAKISRLNPAMLDIHVAGVPFSCTPEVCEIMLKEFEFRPQQSVAESGNYKYILDVNLVFKMLLGTLDTEFSPFLG